MMLHIPIDIVWIVVLNGLAAIASTRNMFDERQSWGFNAFLCLLNVTAMSALLAMHAKVTR